MGFIEFTFSMYLNCVLLCPDDDCFTVGQRGIMWPQEYTLCWEVCTRTTKTWEIPFIPAKSDACMSTPWSMDNVFGRSSHARAERGLLTC